MKFVEVVNTYDRDLLKECGYVQLKTFNNGVDIEKYVFVIPSEVELKNLCNIGLTQYCITNTLTF